MSWHPIQCVTKEACSKLVGTDGAAANVAGSGLKGPVERTGVDIPDVVPGSQARTSNQGRTRGTSFNSLDELYTSSSLLRERRLRSWKALSLT